MSYSQRLLGSILRGTRERQELTQEQVAAKSGVSNKKISRIERGEVDDPGFGDVVPVALVLGLTPNDIASRLGLLREGTAS